MNLAHGVVIGEEYMDYNVTHKQNEWFFVAIPTYSIQA